MKTPIERDYDKVFEELMVYGEFDVNNIKNDKELKENLQRTLQGYSKNGKWYDKYSDGFFEKIRSTSKYEDKLKDNIEKVGEKIPPYKEEIVVGEKPQLTKEEFAEQVAKAQVEPSLGEYNIPAFVGKEPVLAKEIHFMRFGKPQTRLRDNKGRFVSRKSRFKE